MKQDLTITNYEVLNDVLLVAFKEQDDVMIELKKLRMNCPCASCQGETDALGNIYRGPQPKYTDKSFELNGIQPVGYYGLRTSLTALIIEKEESYGRETFFGKIITIQAFIQRHY